MRKIEFCVAGDNVKANKVDRMDSDFRVTSQYPELITFGSRGGSCTDTLVNIGVATLCLRTFLWYARIDCFRCVLPSPYEGLSVRPSVRPSVGRSVSIKEKTPREDVSDGRVSGLVS